MTSYRTLLAASLAAATLGLALPAAAQPVSASEAQLARSLGVAPGAYSLPQLVQLKALKSEGGSGARTRIRHLLNNSGTDAGATRADQLARGLGLAPGALSVAEMQQLAQARVENDSNRAEFVLSGRSHGEARAAARAQLAASLGVRAEGRSLNELVRLQANRRSDND
ncbi:hypothetical protein [Profundibacterium mesophilum]|uniref:Twin arginine translocation signal domain containing protein n=1 Tax=Profundibacterium mesophilum KAUST100406-0324 TaxID=1037889 RepID=A0A921NPY9_9RHOB|nr:hypothetical protein [Profundibacterium mesophilum]KAF0675877.1 Twin arginine translocation signal domain containing protein [Profundibacterium mesophilum KAUST100406-0324]